MQLGMVGLGRMGAAMVQRLLEAGHESGAGHFVKMVHNGIEYGITAPYQRFRSQSETRFADPVLSAMRHAFGGHREKAAS
jgi:6-phosphogluconate dehydrogenase (decarboxylating)